VDSVDAVLDEYAGQVVPLRYHVWWPYENDCFWLFNQPEISQREAYYSVPAVPEIHIDGPEYNLVSYDGLRNKFDERLAVSSPIRVSNFVQTPYLDSVYVSFDLVAEEEVTGTDLRLLLAVTEWRHRCPYPVGVHDHVFRDFVPDAGGYSFVMEQGDSLHFDWAYYIDPEYLLDRLVTNIFIQKFANKGVHQAYSERVPDYSGVEAVEHELPIAVDPNFPNPFNTSTRIDYYVNRGGKVLLSVYTPTGRLVAHIVDGYAGPGSHSVTWDGRDRFGNDLGSGVYYYRLATGEGAVTGKMMLLR
jgi:hypothetical protein